MLTILTVCTGNICRSPVAALAMAAWMSDLRVDFASAGTRARDGVGMTDEAVDLAEAFSVPRTVAKAHRSRLLTPAHLDNVDLVVAMTREHRRIVVEMDPSRLRVTFTARELARMLDGLDDSVLAAAVRMPASAPDPQRARFSNIVDALRARRGVTAPPVSPADDDVVDPFGRSVTTYRRSAAELNPGLAAVERLVRLSASAAWSSHDRSLDHPGAGAHSRGTTHREAGRPPLSRRDRTSAERESSDRSI